MKNFIVAIIFLSIQGLAAQEAEARKTVENFFDAFHKRDTVALKATMSDKTVFHSVSESIKGTRLSSESVDGFLKSIASIPQTTIIEERLLSWEIKVDGAMANVWTPYEFYIDGKLSHGGVNSFQLFRDGNNWKIVHCIDTRRK